MRYDAVERLELLDKRQVGQEKETLWNGPPRSSGPFLELFKVLRINFPLSNDLLNQIDSSRNRISVFNLQGILFFLNLLENGILYFIRNIYFALYSFSKITTPRNCITFDSESFERVNSFSNRTNHEECSAPSISLVPSPTVSRTLSRETHHSVAIHALAIVFLQNAPSCLRTQGRCSLDRRAREEYA